MQILTANNEDDEFIFTELNIELSAMWSNLRLVPSPRFIQLKTNLHNMYGRLYVCHELLLSENSFC